MTRVTQMSESELRRWFALSDYEYRLWLRLGMPWRLQGDEMVFRLTDVQHWLGRLDRMENFTVYLRRRKRGWCLG